MKYPQSVIEEIRARLRVSEVVGRAVTLKRQGHEFVALCPFHKEKSPSFTVNDDKGFFHCFGCGAHGDVIGFISDYEHIGYKEAIERSASLASVSLPAPSAALQREEEKRADYHKVTEFAAAWFESQLQQTAEGNIARQYLEERGIAAATVARFRLGFAPADRQALTRAARAQGISDAQLQEAGLLIALEDATPYARFRRRLMFPIRDRKSRVIAFGGRVLPGEANADAPKYLNSPETAHFHKGRQLYNLDLARRPALESGALLIAEGYMDVLALTQAGIAHAVAPLGTAITAEQLQLAWQAVDTPTLCLDGDSAGARAMQRAMALALPLLIPGKSLNIARLPAGEDPDSLIRRAGVPAMQELVRAALPLSSALWQEEMEPPAATPEGRARQEMQLMQRVGGIRHPGVQQHYRQFMREQMRASRASAAQSAARPASRPPGRGARPMQPLTAQPALPALPPLPRANDARLVGPASALLALALSHPALLDDGAAEEAWLHAPMPESWQQDLHRRITEHHIAERDAGAGALTQLLRDEAPLEAREAMARATSKLGLAQLGEAEAAARAQALWPQILTDLDRARLQIECAQAQSDLAQSLTEENMQRLTQLQFQLEALERERTRYYREDPPRTAEAARKAP